MTQGIRYVEVVKGGWDMHNDLWGGIETCVGELNQDIAALIDDLKAEGKFEDTRLVLTTEFGQSPVSMPTRGANITRFASRECSLVAVSMVARFSANPTIAMACGMPLDQIVYSPLGRPFIIAGHKEDLESEEIRPEGKPIMLFLS